MPTLSTAANARPSPAPRAATPGGARDGTLSDARPAARSGRALAYLFTGGAALLNMAAAVAGDALLARFWPRGEFLLYSALNRYLGFVFGIVGFQLGFGVVRQSLAVCLADRRRVLFNAGLVCGALWLVATLGAVAFSEPIARFLDAPNLAGVVPMALLGLWLFGQTVLHLIVSWLRGVEDVGASNRLSLVCRAAAVLAAAGVVTALSLDAPAYYGGLGLMTTLACVAALARKWRSLECRADISLCRRLTAYSSTRCLDGLLRQASLVALTTIVFALGRGEVAGELGVLQTLLRGMETFFQPMVLLVLADSLQQASEDQARRDVQRLWSGLLLISLPLTAACILLGRPLVELWLGSAYGHLGTALGVSATAALPTVATVLLRGRLDSRFQHSPMAWINGFGLVIVIGAAAILWSLDLLDLISLSAALSAVQWMQFLVLFALLKREYGVRLLDAASCREIERLMRRRLIDRVLPSRRRPRREDGR